MSTATQLPGIKPSKTGKRLKMFLYGKAKVGKTTLAIQFPKPYIIDTEKGTVNDEYVDMINKKEGMVFYSSSFDDVMNAICLLNTTKHDFKTLVIDPMTIIYDDLINECTEYFKAKNQEIAYGNDYRRAAKKMKRLFNVIYNLDMNVIITSHAKDAYSPKMELVGTTFDCYKKMDYIFDLIVKIVKTGSERSMIVEGTRLKNLKEGEKLSPNYESLAERYDAKILEAECIPEILASKDDVKELKNLIKTINYPKEKYQKWLTKCNIDDFDEMNKTDIDKIIVGLKSLISKQLESSVSTC